MDEKIKKLEPVFDGLESKFIDPNKIASNALFAHAAMQYLDGIATAQEVVDIGYKINIISGGAYNSVQYMKA